MNSEAFQHSRASLIFGIVTAAIALGAVTGCLVLIVLGRGYAGCLTVGISACVLGAMRGMWPGRPWFASRSRATDVIAYVLIGGALILFAPWVNALPA